MSDRWLTIEEAATATGRSVRTVQRWIARGRLVACLGRVSYSAMLEVEAQERRRRRSSLKQYAER